MRVSNLITVVALSLALAACSEGDNAAAIKVPQSPEGIYSGFVTSDALKRTFAVSGVVSDSGEGHFINRDTGEQLVLVLGVDGERVAGSLRTYQPGSPSSQATVRSSGGSVIGKVLARDSIAGSYDSGDRDHGSFSLLYDRALYEQSSRLAQLSGVWSAPAEGSYSLTINIGSDGAANGSDSKGCSYSGKAVLPDTRFNLFQVGVLEVSCGATSYKARGWIVRHPAASGAPESIELGFASDTRAYYNRLTKVSAPAAPAVPGR